MSPFVFIRMKFYSMLFLSDFVVKVINICNEKENYHDIKIQKITTSEKQFYKLIYMNS